MTKHFTRLGVILGLILLGAIVASARPANAQQQPNSVNPTADAVQRAAIAPEVK